VEVNDQHQEQLILPPGKVHTEICGQENMLAPYPVWTQW